MFREVRRNILPPATNIAIELRTSDRSRTYFVRLRLDSKPSRPNFSGSFTRCRPTGSWISVKTNSVGLPRLEKSATPR